MKALIKKWTLTALVFAICVSSLTACTSGSTGETAITAALGPADSALPYQAVFAINKNADERLIVAAQNFCRRTSELSNGSAVFSLIMSDNALQDLRLGAADVILIENPEIGAFAPVTEAFRYKSYEHFAMTANSDSTLQILSDILGANVFAGFYAGSNVLLSRGTIDSKFRPSPRKDQNDSQDTQNISVAALSPATARAFSLLKADAVIKKELDERIRACSAPNAVVEFAYSELNASALPETLRANASESLSSTDESGEDQAQMETAPFAATPAFMEIKPVWLVFAASGYEKLSQTNRAATAEAAAYMVSDIDGVYLKHELETLELLAAADVMISHDFTSTRVQALRLADEQSAKLNSAEKKLRDAVATVQ